MDSTRDKASYCIGLVTGKNLLNQFKDMELKYLRDGFEDSLNNTLPKLSQDEIQTIMQALTQQVEQQQRQHFANLSQHNREEGDKFLENNKNQEGVISLKSGLQYKVLEKGHGKKVTAADVVSVHYRGKFIDGSIFDSSYEKGQPQTFPINRVIPGWSEALQLMQVGDKWEIYVPHYLAYGESGFGNEIGPCTTLIFELELMNIN